jgi:putative PIN family toxin of toxin-antitoxin system
VRIVLDPNVLVSAVISPAGPPAQILLAWALGESELLVSPALLEELDEVLARPRLRRWIDEAVASDYVEGLAEAATLIEDPRDRRQVSSDPDDDYLIALARVAEAEYLVSGDPDLTSIPALDPPALTPSEFVRELLGG